MKKIKKPKKEYFWECGNKARLSNYREIDHTIHKILSYITCFRIKTKVLLEIRYKEVEKC